MVDQNTPKYLLTGASGFTGSHLLAHLLEQKTAVRAMVRSVPAFFASSIIPEALKSNPLLEVVEGDLKDVASLARAVSGTCGVYHVAAAFREASLPPSHYFEVNATGTEELLKAAVSAGVQRFIYCSTNGVVSKPSTLPSDETAPYSPGDFYQESKAEGEKIALKYFHSGKVTGMVLRPAMIYGPEDLRLLKIFKLVGEERFFYVGQGNAHVHFIDVRDLAAAFTLAMQKKEINGEVVLIAGEKPFRLHEVVNEIAKFYGVPAPKLHLPVWPLQTLGSICEAICKPFGINPPIYRRRVDFFIKERCFSTAKAQELLGFKPQLSSLEEIRSLCKWYEEHGFVKPKRRTVVPA